ncbi:hypothetical protein K0M31_012846 [Melipona bicolor]|uniref:Uncharacterized protein n=1 Tax=Melipona bicolor TaxID=60889 RepID=A0AA40FJB2_9HYME|nr:hypothetical protein K0M31_012846 [Melipona bicolor]
MNKCVHNKKSNKDVKREPEPLRPKKETYHQTLTPEQQNRNSKPRLRTCRQDIHMDSGLKKRRRRATEEQLKVSVS